MEISLNIEKESRTNRSSARQDVSNHDLVNLFYTLAMLQVIFAGDIYWSILELPNEAVILEPCRWYWRFKKERYMIYLWVKLGGGLGVGGLGITDFLPTSSYSTLAGKWLKSRLEESRQKNEHSHLLVKYKCFSCWNWVAACGALLHTHDSRGLS